MLGKNTIFLRLKNQTSTNLNLIPAVLLLYIKFEVIYL